MHLDEHLPRAGDRLGDVGDDDVGGAGGGEDLDGAHDPQAIDPLPPVARRIAAPIVRRVAGERQRAAYRDDRSP
ncbi:hypothetical protein GCM10025786_22150 [Nocardioides caeni]